MPRRGHGTEVPSPARCSERVAVPKSATFTVNEAETSKFEVFRSRWIWPMLCTCAIPRAMSSANDTFIYSFFFFDGWFVENWIYVQVRRTAYFIFCCRIFLLMGVNLVEISIRRRWGRAGGRARSTKDGRNQNTKDWSARSAKDGSTKNEVSTIGLVLEYQQGAF